MKSDVMTWPEHAYELDEFGATPACDLSGSIITTPVYAIIHEATFDTTLYTHASTYMGEKPYDGGLTGVSYTGTTAKTYFYLTDRLGTVHAIANESGSIVESYRYDAWGRVLGTYNASGIPITESAIGNRYLWQGREYSWKTGLYFFRARWYEPVTGRWLSPDPAGIAGGLNMYMAFNDNPVNFVDPMGLDAYIYIENGHAGIWVDVSWRPDGGAVTYDFSMSTRGTTVGDLARYLADTEGKVTSNHITDEQACSRRKNGKAVYRVTTSPEQDRAMIQEILRQKYDPPPYGSKSGVCVQRALAIVANGSGIDIPSFAEETRQFHVGAKGPAPLINAMDQLAVDSNYRILRIR